MRLNQYEDFLNYCFREARYNMLPGTSSSVEESNDPANSAPGDVPYQGSVA